MSKWSEVLLVVAVTCSALPFQASQAWFKAPASYPIPQSLLETAVKEDPPVLTIEVQKSDALMGSTTPGDLSRLSPAAEAGDITDLGDPEHLEGIDYLLAASFDSGKAGTGKVWVVSPCHAEDSYVVAAGLEIDVGVCYDSVHDYLYAFDSTLADVGRIFQYKATRSKSGITIAGGDYTQIYEGDPVSACFIDDFSNLYFSHGSTISFISFLDLWTGYKNMQEDLYYGEADRVDSPVDIVANSYLNVYWVNTAHKDESLISAPGRYRFGRRPDSLSMSEGVVSIAVNDEFVFKGFHDGSVFAVDKETGVNFNKTITEVPKSMCSGGGRLFLASADNETVSWVSANSDQEQATVLAVVPGLSDLECVLSLSRLLVVSILLLLSVN